MLDNRPILDRILESELNELAARDQLRSLEVAAGINLSSNDYLGLSTHPSSAPGRARCGRSRRAHGATGSRLLSGHSREWEELEAEFAEFAGTEAALCFSSGYAANVGLLSAVLGRGDVVFSDALNHASID